MAKNKDQIVAKIKKLQAVADDANNASEQEIAQAVALIGRLMETHGISQEDISQEVFDENVHVREMALRTRNPWDFSLITMCSHIFLCRAIGYKKSNLVDLVGSTDNTQWAENMYGWIRPQIMRLCNEAYKNAGSPSNRSHWTKTFCLGCVSRLRHITEQQRQEQQALEDMNPAESYAIALRVDAYDELLETAVERFFGRVQVTRRTPLRAAEAKAAFSQGYQAGSQVSLQPTLT